MASCEEQFNAAVNLIHSLPRNGSFQPSNEMLLKFYSFYKQATVGPCNAPQPYKFQMVARAKWDAWNALGNMSKSDAMSGYVDQLKHIIETMPLSKEAGEFMDKLGDFYEIVDLKTGKTLLKPTVENGIPNGRHTESTEMNGLVPGDNTPQPLYNGISPEHGIPTSDESVSVLLNGHQDTTLKMNSIRIEQDSNADKSLLNNSNFQPQINGSDDRDSILKTGGIGGQADNTSVDSDVHLVAQKSDSSLLVVSGFEFLTKSTCDENIPVPNGATADQISLSNSDEEPDSGDDDGEFCDTSDQLVGDTDNKEVVDSPLPPSLSPRIDNHIVASVDMHASGNGTPVSTERAVFSIDGRCARGGEGSDQQTSKTQASAMTPSGSQTQLGGTTGSGGSRRVPSRSSSGAGGGSSGGGGGGGPPDRYPFSQPFPAPMPIDITQHLAAALARLQQDMNHVMQRLSTLEALAVLQQGQRSPSEGNLIQRSPRTSFEQPPSLWNSIFGQVPVTTLALLFFWPFLLHWIFKMLKFFRTLLMLRRARRK